MPVCSACGVDAGCNCGAPVVSKGQRIAEYDAANPGKSTRQVAAALNVGKSTVSDVRNSDVRPRTPEDDRPTIDKPPKGNLWDDQNDRDEDDQTVEKRVIGKDGKERRMPVKEAKAAEGIAADEAALLRAFDGMSV